MIGNDIVDLKKNPLNWKRKGFLEKVFSENEQQLISFSENPQLTVGLLWSMKEAAYKIYVQKFKKRSFNPSGLICFLSDSNHGFVKIENQIYYTNSTITEQFIYSIATSNPSAEYKSDIFQIENESHLSQSKSIRNFFFESFSKENNFNLKHLNIKKNNADVPELFYYNSKLPYQISLTHCGNYSGFVYSR
ncbi:Phosphopantetheinyl transferase (holo-ACP synthase) [Flavobacteriaceae bacterium MAR_2010_188]|nr:Phosphopantetheinyl transferase (holo-ACP synthase) [Flavobacteriaceae bacterium MAR_2010_188]